MILLLAGTAEARALAAALAAEGIAATASLAGATADPAPLAVPTRRGGFGGEAGFLAELDRLKVRAVIDATHPFAARITARTARLCEGRLPLLRLERPDWRAEPGDRWSRHPDLPAALAALPAGARALLATGRGSVAGLPPRGDVTLWLRVIDTPPEPFPDPGGWIVARPPFTRDAERALLTDLGATHLVAKDSGGDRAKLDAARDLGLPVLLIDRPPAPPGLRVVTTVTGAMDWARSVA